MGILLSADGGYEETILYRHLNTGTLFSFVVWGALLVKFNLPAQRKGFNILLAAGSVLVIVTGHLGATLTHGEGYVLQPISSTEKKMILTDSTSLFEMALQPVLDRKCVSCHNEKKEKGELIMTSIDQLKAGGKHGAIWKPGQPDSSLWVQRISLPEDHDDHMPPSGKPQLTEVEIRLIEKWIAAGADLSKPWTKYNDTLRQLAMSMQRANNLQGARYNFAFADRATVEELNTPYLTVKQIASSEPALMADFYLAAQFQSKNLERLSSVKEQLVYLNLSGMPVTDEDMKTIGKFQNLEKLNLNNTKVTSEGLQNLRELKNLTSLSLNGMPLEVSPLQSIAALPKIESIYVWNSGLTQEQLNKLRHDFSSINWIEGYVATDKLKLTPPIVVNEQFLLSDSDRVHFKHNLPGAMIVYTLDGSDPDTVRGRGTVYNQPIAINNYTIVKARAIKEEWFASSIIMIPFFKKGIVPISVELLSKPDKDYRGQGPETLINQMKGDPDNYRDGQWLGFRQNPGIALFKFDAPISIEKITISYNRNIPSYLMPPASVEIWAGNSVSELKLIARETPVQPTKTEPTKALGIVIPLKKQPYQFYKLIVTPVAKLPTWHSGKGEKGWIFLDEVIFEK